MTLDDDVPVKDPSVWRVGRALVSEPAMFLLALAAAALAQVPQSDCMSAFGQTACGYDCKAAFGQVRCADWPGGACAAAFGEVVCGPPAPYMWSHGPRQQKAECRSAFGQTVCGYHCTAAFGQVRCANTPQGRCEAAFGQVTCWDPGGVAVGWGAPVHGARVPEAECKSAFGRTACGYHCVVANGTVTCADWPGGACATAYGQTVCGPPAPPGWQGWWQPGAQAQCVQAFGQVACGYGCTAAFGQVTCAATP